MEWDLSWKEWTQRDSAEASDDPGKMKQAIHKRAIDAVPHCVAMCKVAGVKFRMAPTEAEIQMCFDANKVAGKTCFACHHACGETLSTIFVV